MNYFQSILKRTINLLKALKPLDRTIILFCCILLVIGLLGLLAKKQSNLKTSPIKGGKITEGIVVGNAEMLNNHIQNLTGIGLVRFNEKGEITDAIAKSYEILDNGKEYRFKIKENIDVENIVSQLQLPEAELESAEIRSEGDIIIIKITAPYAPLLSNLTRPILKPGPYKIVNQNNKKVDLKSDPAFIFGEPYIEDIVINLYQNQQQMEKAIRSNEIDSAFDINGSFKGYKNYSLTLPRFMVLFLNTQRAPWDSILNRRRLADLEVFPEKTTINITTTDGDLQKYWLGELRKRFEPLNISIVENIVSDISLKSEIIPKRDYESLLYGIDVGRDPDPYFFWHSSEMTPEGQNLSNFSSKDVDLLLEQARLITDYSKRMERYDQINDIVRQEAVAIFLDRKSINYVVKDKVKDIIIPEGVTFSDRFFNVWQWHIRTKKIKG